jgi:topoisomerase-4 subunit B
LETPLFRVRNKQETIYCYSEQEKLSAMKKLGSKPEVTRFKGLGEISPDEFAQFIGADMRKQMMRLDQAIIYSNSLSFIWGKTHPTVRSLLLKTYALKPMNL